MEEELTCGNCNSLLTKPLNLPCAHNVCYICAKECTMLLNGNSEDTRNTTIPLRTQAVATSVSSGMNTTMNNRNLNDRSDCSSDDSGYLSMHELRSCLHQQIQEPLLSIKCPNCHVSFVLDERGVDGLPHNAIVESLVEFHKRKTTDVECQLCEIEPPSIAKHACEQCCVSYCDSCLKIYHPKRGPLASHSLVIPQNDRRVPIGRRSGVLKCSEHHDENLSMFCVLCQMPVCYLCFEQGRHGGHEARALGTMYKEQKVEMERQRQELNEKNTALGEFIVKLEKHFSRVQENGVDFESQIVAQIDEVINALEAKKKELIRFIADTVSQKASVLSQQSCTYRDNMKSTTALLEYTREVMKDENPASFLLISSSLCSRLSRTLQMWIGKKGLEPAVTSEMELGLKTNQVMESISFCEFFPMKTPVHVEKPKTPMIIEEKCSVANNTLNLQWTTNSDDVSDDVSYMIEVDDGMKGEFQVVHQTPETDCVLGGLQFNSTYRARIKSFNSAGESEASQVIYLTTPPVALFSLDNELSHDDINISNNGCTMTTGSFENRVALGNIGLSRGQHYWEVTIDRYEGNPDPAIGIAQANCSKDVILGKDSKAWSIYVDSSRSWFQHNNAHLFRSEGGIETGSVIGLYLDLDTCQITFFCNEEKHGPIEFPSLEDVDVIYPAFSLNRNVTMTLHAGLTPPGDI